MVTAVIERVPFHADVRFHVGGSDNSYACGRLGIARGPRIGTAPFFTEKLGNALQGTSYSSSSCNTAASS